MLEQDCPGCQARGVSWGKCAFRVGGVFDSDNYRCATMGALRVLAARPGSTHYECDSRLAVIPYDTGVPDGGTPLDCHGFLVMGWSGNDERTARAFVLSDVHGPEVLTLERAAQIIVYVRGGGS